MVINKIISKPDYMGALASSLCLLHCIATPFIFIAQSCSASCCESSPIWWQYVDYVFIIISFFAVYQTTKTSTNKYIKQALWVSWFCLLSIIINEKINWISLPEYSVYIPAITLITLHIYNLKYCQCKTDDCCIHNK